MTLLHLASALGVARHGMTHQAHHHVAQAGMTVHLALVRQAGLAQALVIQALAGLAPTVLALVLLAGINHDSNRDSFSSRYIQRDSDGYLRWIQSRKAHKP